MKLRYKKLSIIRIGRRVLFYLIILPGLSLAPGLRHNVPGQLFAAKNPRHQTIVAGIIIIIATIVLVLTYQ